MRSRRRRWWRRRRVSWRRPSRRGYEGVRVGVQQGHELCSSPGARASRDRRREWQKGSRWSGVIRGGNEREKEREVGVPIYAVQSHFTPYSWPPYRLEHRRHLNFSGTSLHLRRRLLDSPCADTLPLPIEIFIPTRLTFQFML